MTREQLRRVGQIATVIAAVLILWLTMTPNPPSGGPISPTAGHFLLFFFLGVTSALWYATSDLARQSPRRTLFAVLLMLWIFAGATELGQGLVRDRQTDAYDWVANAAGAIAGLFIGSVAARAIITRGDR